MHIADDFVAIRARMSDPVVTLVAERSRIEAETEASAGDGALYGALVERAAERIGRLDDEIADTIATSAAGIIGQVRVLREICEGDYADNEHRSDDCADRLMAAISAAIERLAGGA